MRASAAEKAISTLASASRSYERRGARLWRTREPNAPTGRGTRPSSRSGLHDSGRRVPGPATTSEVRASDAGTNGHARARARGASSVPSASLLDDRENSDAKRIARAPSSSRSNSTRGDLPNAGSRRRLKLEKKTDVSNSRSEERARARNPALAGSSEAKKPRRGRARATEGQQKRPRARVAREARRITLDRRDGALERGVARGRIQKARAEARVRAPSVRRAASNGRGAARRGIASHAAHETAVVDISPGGTREAQEPRGPGGTDCFVKGGPAPSSPRAPRSSKKKKKEDPTDRSAERERRTRERTACQAPLRREPPPLLSPSASASPLRPAAAIKKVQRARQGAPAGVYAETGGTR